MPTVKYTDVDLANLTFTAPEENKMVPSMTKNQLLSIPGLAVNGKSEMPTIQGPWMTLDNYGITSKLDKMGKPRMNQAGVPLSDRERGKLKIPLAEDSFRDLLLDIDTKCEAEREQIFGDKKKAGVYKYQPIVRQAAENPDAPDDAPERPDYCVVKLDFDYKTGALKTGLYVNDGGKRTEVEALTLDDFQKHVRYMCEFRPVFKICKLFAARSANQDGKRAYGLGLKLSLIEVKPMKSTSNESETFFVDTDDEGEEKEMKDLVAQTSKTTVQETTTKTTKGKAAGSR